MLAKPNQVLAGRGVLQAVGGDGGETSEGGRNERQGKKDPSQISFSGGGRAWPEEGMCRGEQLRPKWKRQAARGREQQRGWLQLSGRTDCPEGDEWMNRCWSSRRELNREVQGGGRTRTTQKRNVLEDEATQCTC